MSYQRPHLKLLKSRVSEKRNKIQVIMGPRQVGKTTLITQLLSEIKSPAYFVAADAVLNTNNGWIQQQWETARLKLKQLKAKELLFVIDEIQKIDNWSETIKLLWDDDSRNKVNIKVILLGSSRLLLQQGLTESLAGRFEVLYVGHWTYLEMNQAFGYNANQFAWYGGYPGAATFIKDETRWKNYITLSLIETSISKDILMLTRVDKPALMKRLFELGCSDSAQILSYTKILGQLQDAGNTTTLSNYLNLLNAAGLLAGIEKFSQEKLRQRASSPKFQVHNTALISAQQIETYKEAIVQPAYWGRIVESTVGAHLLNYSLKENFELTYWREGNFEIDFIIKKGQKIVAIEVKSGNKINALGASAFVKKYPKAKLLVIEPKGLTWHEFLTINPIELF